MNIIRILIMYFLSFLEFMVLIECICSWLPFVRESKFYFYITKFNYPFLEPIRRLLNRYSGGMMIDLSPIILFLIINLVRRIIL